MSLILLRKRPDPTRARDVVKATRADLLQELKMERAFRELGRPYRLIGGGMGMSTWAETLAVVTVSGTAVASTASETSLLAGSSAWTQPGYFWPPLQLPAGYLTLGKQLRVKASGRISNTATPTITFKLEFGAVGGTVLVNSGALTSVTSLANDVWTYEATLVCQAVGSGTNGSIFGTGVVTGITGVASGVNTFGSAGAATPAAVGIDTTVTNNLQFTATWGTSSASNTIQLHQFSVEVCNL